MRCSFSSVTKGGPISKSSDAICRKEDVLGEPGFDTKDRRGTGKIEKRVTLGLRSVIWS